MSTVVESLKGQRVDSDWIQLVPPSRVIATLVCKELDLIGLIPFADQKMNPPLGHL